MAQKTDLTPPVVHAVGFGFTRPDESIMAFSEGFFRSQSPEKIDDLVKTLMQFGKYKGGNVPIYLSEIKLLPEMVVALKAAGHGKTVKFIENSQEETDCDYWCIYVMERADPANADEEALLNYLAKKSS